MVLLSWFLRKKNRVVPAVAPKRSSPSKSPQPPHRSKAASRLGVMSPSPMLRHLSFPTIHHVQLGRRRIQFEMLRCVLPRFGSTKGWTTYGDFLHKNNYRDIPRILKEYTKFLQVDLGPRLRQQGNPDVDLNSKHLRDKWWMYTIFQDGNDLPQLSAIAYVDGSEEHSKHILSQLVALGMIVSNDDLRWQHTTGQYSMQSCRILCAGLMRFFPTYVYVDNLSGTYMPSTANLHHAANMLTIAFGKPVRGISRDELTVKNLPHWFHDPPHPDALEIERDRNTYSKQSLRKKK